MKQETTEVIINAPVEKVWNVLTDFENYINWNTFIPFVIGEAKIGSPLTICTYHKADKAATMWYPTLIVCDPLRELRWKGRLPGLLNRFKYYGEHFFILEKLDANKTKLLHGEVCGGLWVRKQWDQISHLIRRDFTIMNEALVQRCEKDRIKPYG